MKREKKEPIATGRSVSKCPKGCKNCELCKIFIYRNKKYLCSGIVRSPIGVPKFDVIAFCDEKKTTQVAPDEALAIAQCLNYSTMIFLTQKFKPYRKFREMK